MYIEQSDQFSIHDFQPSKCASRQIFLRVFLIITLGRWSYVLSFFVILYAHQLSLQFRSNVMKTKVRVALVEKQKFIRTSGLLSSSNWPAVDRYY